MPDVTDDEIKALLELEARCTPAPWEWYEARSMRHLQGGQGGPIGLSMPLPGNRSYTKLNEADAEVVPAARNAIRPALESLLREREARRRAEEALKRIAGIEANGGSWSAIAGDCIDIAHEALAELHRPRATQTPEPGHD